MEREKTKAKNYYLVYKENCKKDCMSIIEIFLKMKKWKNNYANITNKNILDADREKLEEHIKIITKT